MHLIPTMLILWGIVVTTMIALLVFNATCCNCDQPCPKSEDSEAYKKRRLRIFARAQRMHPYIRASGSISALVTAGLVGVAGWAALESLIH